MRLELDGKRAAAAAPRTIESSAPRTRGWRSGGLPCSKQPRQRRVSPVIYALVMPAYSGAFQYSMVAVFGDRRHSGRGRQAPLTPVEIRGRRRALGLTQADLAAVLDVSANTVARWERGELRVGRPGLVVRCLERLERRPPEAATARRAPATAPTKARRSGTRRAGPGEQPRALPGELSSFVGRELELRHVRRLLESARLLTLTGTGGVGKTRLAVALLQEVKTAGREGLVFVDLAPLADPALVPQTVASAVGVGEQPGRSPVATLIDVIHRKPLLLVLDKCEHLIQAQVRTVSLSSSRATTPSSSVERRRQSDVRSTHMESLNRSVSVNARPAPFALDPSCTAVIVVDMQNDFASEGGAFARSGRDISSIRSIIGPTSGVLTAARDAGMKVIYLKIEFRADLSDVGPPQSKNWQAMHAVGIGECVTASDGRLSQIFIRNTWNTDIVSELTPQPSDIVVSKRRYSGFYGTDLDSILRGLGIKDLVFTGCTTSVCVESTLRDAMYRDYRCLLLADCTAEPIGQGLARSNHEATLLLTEIPFGWVSDSVAVLEALAARSVGQVGAAATDPLAVVEALDTARNAGDLEAVMALFAADAVVRQLPPPPDGGVYRGNEQVFLDRPDLSPASRRLYAQTLQRLGHAIGDNRLLGTLDGSQVETAIQTAWERCAAATWNRHVATVRSFMAFCRRHGWLTDEIATDLDRRREPADRTRAIPLAELERLWRREDAGVRERAFAITIRAR